MTTKPPRWFGNLLDWRYDPQVDMHCAWHNDRTYHLTKLTRRDADAHRTHPGWHLWYPDPHPDGWHGLGVDVGGNLPWAKRMAEAWIICPYDEMMNYPKLHLAVSGAGLLYDGLVIWPNDAWAQFDVHRDRIDVPGTRGEFVGEIIPHFDGPAGTVTVRWHISVARTVGVHGSEHATWTEAVRALHAAVTDGAEATR